MTRMSFFIFYVFTAAYLDRSHVFENPVKTVNLKCHRCPQEREKGHKFASNMSSESEYQNIRFLT